MLRVLIEDLSVPSTLVAKKLGVNKVKMSRAFNGKTSLEFDQRRLLLEVLSTTLDALEKGLVAAEKGSTSRVLSERLPIAQSKLETGRKVVEREEANLAEC